MEPEDTEPDSADIYLALSNQGSLLGQQDQTLSDSNQALVNQITLLTNQAAILASQLSPQAPTTQPSLPASPASTQSRELYVPDPEPYAREHWKKRVSSFNVHCFFSQGLL